MRCDCMPKSTRQEHRDSQKSTHALELFQSCSSDALQTPRNFNRAAVQLLELLLSCSSSRRGDGDQSSRQQGKWHNGACSAVPLWPCGGRMALITGSSRRCRSRRHSTLHPLVLVRCSCSRLRSGSGMRSLGHHQGDLLV